MKRVKNKYPKDIEAKLLKLKELIKRYEGTHLFIDVTGPGMGVADQLDDLGCKLTRVRSKGQNLLVVLK